MYNPSAMQIQSQPSRKSFFPSSGRALALVVALLLGLGLAIRLYDLTDLPLDFHATRQLFSATKARGMYYQTLTEAPPKQRQFAIQQWKKKATIEPEILERLAAYTYRFTGEQLWVARVYSSAFWVIGGLFLFLLVRRSVSADGAFVSLAFYLFLPYAVIASRAFQPDPLMAAMILAFWWCLDRWGERPAWGWTLLAGLLGGLAILVKLVAAFFIIGAALGIILSRFRVAEVIRNPKVWALVILGAMPGAIYVLNGIASAGLTQQFGGRFIPALLLSPLNYWRWFRQIGIVMGAVPFLLGLLSLFFFKEKRPRIFVIALWVSYIVYGLYFDYHIASHDYYSLVLIPIVAVSLAAPAGWLFAGLARFAARSRWLYGLVIAVLAAALAAPLLYVRHEMASVDYRPQAGYWADLNTLLDGYPTVALTQDYGLRMAYWGWRSLIHWPTSGDLHYRVDIRSGQEDFREQFDSLTAKKRFFLVTDLEDLERQPLLKEWLAGRYSLFAQGEGYLVFDLEAPVQPVEP